MSVMMGALSGSRMFKGPIANRKRRQRQHYTTPDYTLDSIVIDGKTVIQLIVQRGQQPPYFYKGKAYREAVLNALMHRRLDINSPVQIAMYDDRIEITSPGGLPPGISKSDYLYGWVSNPRNLTICMAFYMLNYVEQFGTGVTRIRLAYEGFADEPEFDISENYIRISLPVIDHYKPLQNEDLPSHVLRLLSERDSLSAAELEILTGYSRSSIQAAMKQLIGAGLVRKTGTARSTRYELDR